MASVDVVVPCYQYGRFLRECVGSVLSQGLGDVRVLIIDNASTDDSVEVACQLAAEDKRVEVLVNPRNIGATGSYNKGIEWASAEYFVLLDADDMLAPGCFERALPVMEAHREIAFTHGTEAFLHSAGTIWTPKGEWAATHWDILPGHEYIRHFCRAPVNRVGAPTVVRRTAVQKLAGYYRSELPYSDDIEMWLRLAMHGSIGTTRTIQGIRRIHPSRNSEFYLSSVVREFKEREAALVSFFSNDGRAFPQSSKLLAVARRRLGQHAYWSAVSHLCRAYFGQARRLFEYAFRSSPTVAFIPPFTWLFRMDRPLGRAVDIILEALRRAKIAREKV